MLKPGAEADRSTAMTSTTEPTTEDQDAAGIIQPSNTTPGAASGDLPRESAAISEGQKHHLDRDSSDARRPNPARSLWVGALAGAIVAAPLSWLLGDAAYLPFFLGLFFFTLFGLVIGAVTYRIAGSGRPYRSSTVRLVTTLLVLFALTGSIVKESSGFADDVIDDLLQNPRTQLGDRNVAQFKDDVRGEVRDFLKNSYAPGGLIGYLRWVVDSGEISETDLASANSPIVWPQRKLIWMIRVFLAAGLLAFGIASQTLGLAAPRPTAS